MPSQNILWDPNSQTLAVMGKFPDQFVYMTPGNGNAKLVDEYARNTTPASEGQWVVMVDDNGVLYGGSVVGQILADIFNFTFSYSDNGQSNSQYKINIVN